MSRFDSSVILILIYLCAETSTSQARSEFEANQAFQQGHYDQAISQWQSQWSRTSNTKDRLNIWLNIARAYRRMGAYDQALNQLNTALPLAQEVYHQILLRTELSKLYFSKGERWREPAIEQVEQALKLSRSAHNLLLAEVLNHWGNLLTAENDYEGSLAAYREAMNHLTASESPALYGKLLINKAQTIFLLDLEAAYQYQNKNIAFNASIAALKSALPTDHNWPDRYNQVFGLITLGRLAQKIQIQLTEPSAQLRQIAYQSLNQAKKIAEDLNHSIAKAYSYGYFGQLYEQNQRIDEALRLTRQALFFAQQTQKKSLLYYWQWQLGRLLKAQGDNNGAIVVYQQAMKNLTPIRFQVATTGYFDKIDRFQEQVVPVYFELADLLLQQAKTTPIETERQRWLQQARETIEFLKEAELHDYFKSECVNIQTTCTHLEDILDEKTAVLYPILLSDRLELLLNLPEGLIQATQPITKVTLQDQIGRFLFFLRRPPEKFVANSSEQEVICTALKQTTSGSIETLSQQLFNLAQTLYAWLIEPVKAHLVKHHIETLVIIPDGPLRTLPFSVLHDGEQFLVQKYALAVAPGLCLNKPQIFQRQEINILLSGLSNAVQGFSALPCVEYELQQLQQLFQIEYQPLLNKNFTVQNIQNTLNQADYSIVHIASHGQFSANLENTFVLTYNDKLSLDRLEQLMNLTTMKDKPVELLTLSACETAVGDDRAALGLAGVAIKAGVKSALASLWKVDDEATMVIILEFYRQLQKLNLSKAQALQKVQKMILTDKKYERFKHPYYWSPFLLIGSWL